MDYKLPKEVLKIISTFQNAGYQIYIVGGAVRDLLMGRIVKDWDFTTDAKPEEILKLFPKGFYDNKFGTVGVPTNPSKHLQGKDNYEPLAKHLEGEIMEITTMRQEGKYTDFRHPQSVGWTTKLEEDLARRDFTINAIALGYTLKVSTLSSSEVEVNSFETKQTELIIIDPFNGQKDIQNGILRCVGKSSHRFQEDALRMLRAIRIATELEFEIEENTFKAIQQNAHLIEEIAWERIRDELLKLLASINPYAGLLKIRESGILQIILPELEKCFGIYQEGPKHDRQYDIGEHSLLTLKYTPSNDPIVRLAALLHDIGKPDTVKKDSTGNVTFYQHDVIGGKIVKKISKRFHLPKKQTEKIYLLVRWHLFTVDENQTDSAIRRFIKNIGIENIEDMMAVRVGDRLGGGTQTPVSWRMEKFLERIKEVLKKPFSISDLKVNGNDVMKVLGIKPGPKVGKILNQLFEEVLENYQKNTKEYLLERVKGLS